MFRKITDCESFDISRENVYDGVYFTKVTNLQCTDCNSALKRLLRKFF